MKGKPSAESRYIAVHKAGHGADSSSETGYWIAGTRVSLDSVVRAFKEGRSPETIAAECFPTLSLEQVYGAIAHYLSRREELDAYLAEAETHHRQQRSRHEDPAFARRLRAARRQGHRQAPSGETSARS